MQTETIMTKPYQLQDFAFQTNSLARLGEFRTDDEFIQAQLHSDKSRFILLHKQTFLLQPSKHNKSDNNKELLLLTKKEFDQNLAQQNIDYANKHLIYLGENQNQHYFAYRLSKAENLEYLSAKKTGLEIHNLRGSVALLPAEQSYLANVAIALAHWHSSHQYCGFCGALTYSNACGYVRSCSNDHCSKDHFPRTDPAVIVAITHTDENDKERILLGRQASWPQGRYSIIAGFVEPGESLEQSVKREALEETGIKVDDVEYIASQPWPFPQSLMVGFTAKATTTKIELRDKELEDAVWLDREELKKRIANKEILSPQSFSISRYLIEQWLNQTAN